MAGTRQKKKIHTSTLAIMEGRDFDTWSATSTVDNVLKRLSTNKDGLDQHEVRARHLRYGYNQPSKSKETHPIVELLLRFKDPLIVVLLVVGTVSLLMGQTVSALLVYFMAFASVILSFVQERRAKNEARKLGEMVSTTASVIRGGKQHEVHLKMLVPGDIIYLSAGDIIPADLRIISAKDLFINQASLSGESYPVEKTPDPCAGACKSTTDLPNIAFMGSNVVSGTAFGVVIATGDSTMYGELVVRVGSQEIQTRFDKGIHDFVMLLIKFMVVMVVAIFAINSILKGNILEAFLFSLAVAVGLTPEMLPMMVAINLSNGAIKMSQKKVIVKKLSAIQNFGAMDVLCTDKTGTLTLGEVVLERHFDLNGVESEDVMRFAYLNSHFQTGLKNLLDKAILKHQHPSIHKFEKVDEIPFDFSRKLMSVVVETAGAHVLISKGAPEEIVRRCGRYELDGKVYQANGKMPADITERADDYRREGFRVLAVAYKDYDAKRKSYSKSDEEDLVLKGYIIFLDPPKPTARNAIESLRALGITTKILTGDNELITAKVCGDVGLDAGEVVTGDMVESAADSELDVMAEKHMIFARLNPMQKERVIEALRRNGHTVGYMGDGINDAPALKGADVGISVNNAVDIAKETADIILLEKSLMVLGDGVKEGRRTYANLLKYVKMGASSNFGNMFSVVGGSIFLPFLPMQPIQILLNNFLYDISQTSLPSDYVDPEYLDKPTPWNIEYIRKVMIFFGPISSIFDFTTYGVLLFFGASQPMFNTIWFLESLATQTLIVHVIRTSKIPFIESRPSMLLLVTTLFIVSVGILITYSPLGPAFGFVPPTLFYLGAVTVIVFVYLILTQLLKMWFVKRFGYQ
jgi:Mg2+-importing ATPase